MALLALASLLLLSGCATGSPPGGLLFGFSHKSRPFFFLQVPGSQLSALPDVRPEAVGGAGGFPTQVAASTRADKPGTVPSCGGQALPPGWPDFSSDDGQTLLAPFLTCSSPADFLALQQRVDMPRLVTRLDDWSAVRLGSLGPVREDTAGLFNRKRTSFLVQSIEGYGAANTEASKKANSPGGHAASRH